jgi:ABC-type Zn uptake system ZnuABC Zn-binding protein ZnuA
MKFLISLIPLLALIASCKPQQSTQAHDDGKLRVLATFLPVHAHAAAIAGDRAIVESLITGDIGAHDFSPKPSDMQRITQADVLVFNGAGMEPWLNDLVREAGSKNLRTVDLSKDTEFLTSPPRFGSPPAAHPEPNPHTWLDPVIAAKQVEILRDALIAADPDGAAIYQDNAAAYLTKLRDLDAEFRRVLDPLPSKKLVTFHDAFPYLARRYGLESIGYISEFPERDPSPAELANLIERIRAAGVKVLFAETGYEPALLQRVASESGARVSSIDTLEVGTPGPDAYIDRMKLNLDALRQAFAP